MPDDRTKGMYGKYSIERLDEQPVGDAIVLEVKDPNTWDALETWADAVHQDGYFQLASDTRDLVKRYRREHRIKKLERLIEHICREVSVSIDHEGFYDGLGMDVPLLTRQSRGAAVIESRGFLRDEEWGLLYEIINREQLAAMVDQRTPPDDGCDDLDCRCGDKDGCCG